MSNPVESFECLRNSCHRSCCALRLMIRKVESFECLRNSCHHRPGWPEPPFDMVSKASSAFGTLVTFQRRPNEASGWMSKASSAFGTLVTCQAVRPEREALPSKASSAFGTLVTGVMIVWPLAVSAVESFECLRNSCHKAGCRAARREHQSKASSAFGTLVTSVKPSRAAPSRVPPSSVSKASSAFGTLVTTLVVPKSVHFHGRKLRVPSELLSPSVWERTPTTRSWSKASSAFGTLVTAPRKIAIISCCSPWPCERLPK